MLSPLSAASRPIAHGWAYVSALTGWIIDWALLLRVIAVFPRPTTSRRVLVAILAFPVVCKMVRLSFIIYPNEHIFARSLEGGEDVYKSAERALKSASSIAHWSLQMVDNGWVSHVLNHLHTDGFSVTSLYSFCTSFDTRSETMVRLLRTHQKVWVRPSHL
jgi:hypothetical protein